MIRLCKRILIVSRGVEIIIEAKLRRVKVLVHVIQSNGTFGGTSFACLKDNFIISAPCHLVKSVDIKAPNPDLIEVDNWNVIVGLWIVNGWNLNRNVQLFDGARTVVVDLVTILNIFHAQTVFDRKLRN